MRKVCKTALFLVLVSSIFVTAAGPKGGPEIVRITGVITGINDVTQQLSVAVSDTETIIVQVTDDTVITLTVKKVKYDLEFEDLLNGMTVKICVKIVDDILLADKINVMYGGK